MGEPKNFKPKFRTATGSFSGRTFDPERERDQKLHKTEEWKRFSYKYLKENPECYCCGEKSEVTDHIRASKGDINWFWKDGNYLPLCKSCHNSVTGRFDCKTRGSEQEVARKVRWMNEQRSRNQVLKDRVFTRPKYVSANEFKKK